MRRADQGGIIRSVWEELSEPWRAGVEEAWEAYRSGSLPIGAVVTDAHGHVLSRGRNRIHERSGPSGTVFDHKLAHAELNALLSLDHREYDPQACVLWSTTEPCPLCVGAARMSEVGGLRYASREPWGGSAAMFETVPYLKRKNVGVMGPQDGRLEGVLGALKVESFLRLQPKILERFLRLYEETMPEATAAGRRLHRSGLLPTMSDERAPASEVLMRVGNDRVDLTAAEFEVLRLLAAHPGWVYSRQQIMEQLWDGEFYGEVRTADVHVRNIRRKIETDPKNPRYILTVRGTGYKFAEIA